MSGNLFFHFSKEILRSILGHLFQICITATAISFQRNLDSCFSAMTDQTVLIIVHILLSAFSFCWGVLRAHSFPATTLFLNYWMLSAKLNSPPQSDLPSLQRLLDWNSRKVLRWSSSWKTSTLEYKVFKNINTVTSSFISRKYQKPRSVFNSGPSRSKYRRSRKTSDFVVDVRDISYCCQPSINHPQILLGTGPETSSMPSTCLYIRWRFL